MPDRDPLHELLQRTQPSLKQIFTRFRMPPDVVEEILEDCLMVLVYRYDQLAQPDRWLLRTVRFRCLRYWRQRRYELSMLVQGVIFRWLEDESCDEATRQQRREELERQLQKLPPRCRRILGEIFRLVPPEGPIPPSLKNRVPRGGPYSPESPRVRCMNHLLRRLLMEPPRDLGDLRLL